MLIKTATGTASTAGCRQPCRPAGMSTAAACLPPRQGMAWGVPKSPTAWHGVNFSLTGCYPHCCAPPPQTCSPGAAAAALHVPEPGHRGDQPSRHRAGTASGISWARSRGGTGDRDSNGQGLCRRAKQGQAGGPQHQRCLLHQLQGCRARAEGEAEGRSNTDGMAQPLQLFPSPVICSLSPDLKRER